MCKGYFLLLIIILWVLCQHASFLMKMILRKLGKHKWLVDSSLDIRNELRRHITFKNLLRKKLFYNLCLIFEVFLVGIWVVAFGSLWKQHFRWTCCFPFVGDALSGHVWKMMATQTTMSGVLRTEDSELRSFIFM